MEVAGFSKAHKYSMTTAINGLLIKLTQLKRYGSAAVCGRVCLGICLYEIFPSCTVLRGIRWCRAPGALDQGDPV